MQDGRETVIHPGEFALYDTTRPYELKFNHAFTQTIFKVPREMLQRRLGATETLTAMSFGADCRSNGSPMISSSGFARARTDSPRTTLRRCRSRPSICSRWR